MKNRFPEASLGAASGIAFRHQKCDNSSEGGSAKHGHNICSHGGTGRDEHSHASDGHNGHDYGSRAFK